MGIGTTLGQQLRQCLEEDASNPKLPRALANRLVDSLGSEDWLKGPIRDLCSQPLLLEALRGGGAKQESALSSLRQQLSRTYAPEVLQELLDLLEAATGFGRGNGVEPLQASTPPITPSLHQQIQQRDPIFQGLGKALATLKPDLLATAPGVALAAISALVLAWIAGELDKALFDAWGWSGGVALVLILGFIQVLLYGLQKGLKKSCHWSLDSQQAVLSSEDWRWITAPWIHQRNQEAALNLVVLLLILGEATAPLSVVVLRYALTALATTIPTVLLARRWKLDSQWSGPVGPISALISLAATLSLLHGKSLGFHTPLLTLPAWVLLLVYGALQLNWQLPRSKSQGNGNRLQRLLCSQWLWGLIYGLGWAFIAWGLELMKASTGR